MGAGYKTGCTLHTSQQLRGICTASLLPSADRCVDMVCPAAGECANQGTCLGGSCSTNTPKQAGTPCSTGQCDGAGTCGEWARDDFMHEGQQPCIFQKTYIRTLICPPATDPCYGVTCPAAGECATQGQCSRGSCSANTPKQRGTPCSTGQCDGAGECGEWLPQGGNRRMQKHTPVDLGCSLCRSLLWHYLPSSRRVL